MSYVRSTGDTTSMVVAGGVSAGARLAFQALFAGLVFFRKKLLGSKRSKRKKK